MLDVLSFVAMRQQRIKDLVAQYVADGYEPPRLAIVTDDQNNAANASYVRSKKQFADACGIVCDVLTLNDADDFFTVNLAKYDGVIVQYPFRDYSFDAFRAFVNDFVPARADVDGLRYGSRFYPCTPLGIMNYLDHLRDNGTLRKDNLVVNVVGCGGLVGKPLVDMLLKDSQYSVCVTRSTTPENVSRVFRCHSDVVVLATPKFNLLRTFNPDIVYIDCGCELVDGKLLGNVCRECYGPERLITPVPGGVGRLTVLALFENVIEAYLDGIIK